MKALLAHATSIITHRRRVIDVSGYGFNHQDINKSFYSTSSCVAVLPGAYSASQVSKAVEAKATIYTQPSDSDDVAYSLSRLLIKSGYTPKPVRSAREWRLLKIRQLEIF